MIRSDHGFTLVEVMIGTALGLLVSAGMAASTIGSLQTTAVSNQVTSASSLVHDKMEQLRSLDPLTNPVDLLPGDHTEAGGQIDELGQAGGAFTRTWTVTPNTPIQGVSQVVVSVAWNGTAQTAVRGVTYVCDTPSCA